MLVHDNVLSGAHERCCSILFWGKYTHLIIFTLSSSLPLPSHLTDVEATTWITGIISKCNTQLVCSILL